MGKLYSTNIEISQFFDFRKFLEAVVDDLREQGVFSHRTFNRQCGFGSPNFIQLVIQRKRNLSSEASKRVAKTIGLSQVNTKAFLRLREIDLAEDPETRFELLQSLLSQEPYQQRYELSQAQLSFYSKWFNIPVRELLQAHPHLTAEMISSALIPKVSVADIENSLKTMLELGLITHSKTEGWKVVHKQISTPNELLNEALFQFQSSMIEIAKQSLSRFPGSEREVSSITLQLTHEEFLILRTNIRDFKKDALASETCSSDSQVYQFNFQLFPVAEKIKGSDQ